MRMTFFILCSLLISGTALARQHWNRSYFDVWKVDHTLEISFLVFDYDFGPAGENGYLSTLFCDYSLDGVNFKHFMHVSTKDQRYIGNWTWVDMKYKLRGAKIQFRNSFVPAPGTLWADKTDYRVEFNNWANGSKAWFSVIWNLENNFKDIKSLRITGVWWVNGIYWNDIIESEIYPIDKIIISESKTPVSIDILQKQMNSRQARVSQAGEIVIKGAATGQPINVYTTTGALVNTTVADNDVVKINLPSNQIYIVKIGQKRHRVAM